MAMCGYQVAEETQVNEALTNIVISGGVNGNIMIWRIPSRKEVERCSSTLTNKSESENQF
jgi:hypothetical protein